MKLLQLLYIIFITLIYNSIEPKKLDINFGYKTWQPLTSGDTIYIISPSHSFLDEESYFAHINFLKDYISTNFGINIKYNKNVFQNKDPMCPEKAMSTEAAFKDLESAFNDPDVKAIWAIRGGRLSLELWPLLEDIAKKFPFKPLLGFSDTTSLHLFMNSLGFTSIHCPVLSFFKESPTPIVNKLTSLHSTFDILMGKTPTVTYKGFAQYNEIKESYIKGRILGGNLSSLHYYDSVYDSPNFPTIWMIETVDDYTRVESILEALLRGKLFKNAQAIIFGNLHGKSFDDPIFSKVQERYELIIKRFAKKTSIPVFSIISKDENSSFAFGHGDINNPFPLGTEAVLDVNSNNEETSLTISPS